MERQHIIFDYYYGITPLNYILYKRHITDKGKEKYNVEGYFGMNLKLLKKRILELYVFENVLNKDTQQLLNDLDNIITKIEEAFE
jgi:RNA binding exosome subunit